MIQPHDIETLQEVVLAHRRIRVRGGGTKPGLSAPVADEALVDLTALSGIVEYTPEECTFTARAGTSIAEIERALAPHGQYLPFDPLFVEAGATIGGTVAAGVNGSRRYRFGGIRDFIIGARLVDGRGRALFSGGKVVKNAAGFLLHQAVVGSCGTVGVLTELTFKVFPASEAHVTACVPCEDIRTAIEILMRVQRARLDLEALDIRHAPHGHELVVRFGGFREALDARVGELRQAIGRDATLLADDEDRALWADVREVRWAPQDATLVRVPTSLPVVATLDAALATHGATRRHTVAGNLALVAWPGPLDALDTLLTSLSLTGQVWRGEARRDVLGVPRANAFGDRLRAVFDPDGRF